MFDLFQVSHRHPNAQRLPPEYDYIRSMYLRELLNLQDYYSQRIYAVKNQNFLVRLLTHIDTPFQYETERFIEITRARAPYVAKAFRMTSDIEYGDIHAGSFFGPGTDEIIIYEDSYFDPVYAEKNWRRINAVQLLDHPRSDLGFLLPNGKATSTDTGLAVISINLPLLAVQLRCFFKDQFVKRYLQDGGSLGLPHFVHMYVLPNMLYSHTDIMVLNRMMCLFYDRPMGQALVKHPFAIVNYGEKLDRVLMKILEDYYDRRMDYFDLLSALPMISQKNAALALQLPDLPPTRQLWWSLVISRLKAIRFLVDLGGDGSLQHNRQRINQLQVALKRLKNQVYPNILPYETTQEINVLMDSLLEL